MSTRAVRLVATNHDSTQPLHEIRVSPGTLTGLGVSCYGWLLLGEEIPCFAAVEPMIDEGIAVVPHWMLRRVAPESRMSSATIELRKHPANAAASLPSAAARAQLIPAALPVEAEASSSDIGMPSR